MKPSYVCIDNSGSTSGSRSYWSKVHNLVEQTHKENPNCIYILWNTDATVVHHQKLTNVFAPVPSGGGTSPECFAKLLDKEVATCTIITDGEIPHSNVDRVDEYLTRKKITFEKVNVYLLADKCDVSVVAPFIRSTDFKIYTNENIEAPMVTSSTKSVFDVKAYYDQPQKFIDEFATINSTIYAANVGQINQQLRNDLLDLQKNLLKFISNETYDVDEFAAIRTLLINAKQTESEPKVSKHFQKEAMMWMKGNIDDTSNQTNLASDVEQRINRLVKICDGTKNYSLSNFTPQRLVRSDVVQDADLGEIPLTQAPNQWECPIMLSDDTPCLMVLEGRAITNGWEKGLINSLLTNPFMLLQNGWMKEMIAQRLDLSIGVNALGEIMKSPNPRSPYSRKDICGGFVFTDHKAALKANTFCLSKLLFDDTKFAGNVQLYLCVLYVIISEHERYKELRPIVWTYLKNELQTKKTYITLSGLPIYPVIQAPVDIALWYCINSAKILGSNHEGNRLKAFASQSKYMMQIVDELGLWYNKRAVTYEATIYKTLYWMFDAERSWKCKPHLGDWRLQLRAHFQNSIRVAERIVLVNGKATEESKPGRLQPEFLNEVPIIILVALAEKVDLSKKWTEVELDIFNLKGLRYDVVTDKYNSVYKGVPVPICKSTMRPWTIDRTDHVYWKEKVKQIYGEDKFISGCNELLKYTYKYNCYPTKDEFIFFLSAKYKILPSYIKTCVDSVFEDYKEIMKEVPIEKFIRIAKASQDITNRMQMEGLNTMGEAKVAEWKLKQIPFV